ncbi:MAG: branched-chain amino acid ABC transporter permease [Burkholderiaceae bacterium]
MSEFLQLLISGLTTGSIYGLVAVGFCIVYNTTEVINFAQGEFVMLGGMMAAALAGEFGWPVPVALLLAVAFVTLIGLVSEKLTIGLSRKPEVLNLIIVTIGLAIVIKGVVMMVWGKFPKVLPAFSGEKSLAVLGASITPQALWVAGIALLVMVAVGLFMKTSVLGTAMRAAAADRGTAALMGIPVARLSTVSFGVASGIGALAGVIITPLTMTSYDQGTILGLKGFCAAIIGGMGNVFGAFLGGLILGGAEAFTAGLGGSGYQDAVAFLLLIILLLVRPSGLLGGTGRERVVKF